MRSSSTMLCILVANLALGCGRTRPEDNKGPSPADSGRPAYTGHAPELVGLKIEFVEQGGDLILRARSRLGDIDDDLVPGGTVSGWLRDSTGAERTNLNSIPLGSPPTELPEPTLLEIPFSVARDVKEAWEVQLTLTDRAGNVSESVKQAWIPLEDTGTPE